MHVLWVGAFAGLSGQEGSFTTDFVGVEVDSDQVKGVVKSKDLNGGREQGFEALKSEMSCH